MENFQQLSQRCLKSIATNPLTKDEIHNAFTSMLSKMPKLGRVDRVAVAVSGGPDSLSLLYSAIDFFGNNIVFAQTKDFLPMKFPVIELEIKEYPDFPPIPLFHFGAILELEEFGKFAENLLRQDVKFIVKPMVTNAGQENEHRMTFFYDPSGYPIEMKAMKLREW